MSVVPFSDTQQAAGLLEQYRNQWWRLPGLTFGQPAGGSGALPPGFGFLSSGLTPGDPRGSTFANSVVQIPEEFRAEYGDDIQGFYDFAQRSSPAVFDDLRSTGAANIKNANSIAGAISGLEGVFGQVSQGLEDFRGNADRAAIGESLAARAAPGARAISELEEGAARNQIAQAAALAAERSAAGAGGRGVVGAGTTLQNTAALDALAAGQGVQLGANVSAANEASRRTATDALSRFTDRGTQIEQGFLDRLSLIESEIARIESTTTFEPTDFVSLFGADFGVQQFLDAQGRIDTELGLNEEAAELSLVDILNIGLSLRGTGLLSGN